MNQANLDEVMSLDVFQDTFDPLENWVSLEEAKRHDPKNVWTVLDCDGALYASAGFRFVNRIGDYIVTRKPWQTGIEDVLLDCGCDVDEEDCEACACIPA